MRVMYSMNLILLCLYALLILPKYVIAKEKHVFEDMEYLGIYFNRHADDFMERVESSDKLVFLYLFNS